LAARHEVRTIAFPAISTGIYGYPLDKATPVALRTIKQYLNSTQKSSWCALFCGTWRL